MAMPVGEPWPVWCRTVATRMRWHAHLFPFSGGLALRAFRFFIQGCRQAIQLRLPSFVCLKCTKSTLRSFRNPIVVNCKNVNCTIRYGVMGYFGKLGQTIVAWISTQLRNSVKVILQCAWRRPCTCILVETLIPQSIMQNPNKLSVFQAIQIVFLR